MYPKQQSNGNGDSSQKNGLQPQQQQQQQHASGHYMMGGPPPPAYTKEVEASAPQYPSQYPMGQSGSQHAFHSEMQPYPGGVHYAQVQHQQPNMYYPNGGPHQMQMAMPHMGQGMYVGQQPNPYQAGPPPGYGGGPQYPTGYCPPPPYQSPVQVQHQQTVYHQPSTIPTATFDAGARFGGKGGGSVSVPPPPPGYAPTAAQVAAMNGNPVIAQQKSQGFFTGGKGAGATFW